MRILHVLAPFVPFAVVAACTTGGTGEPSSLAQGGIECHEPLEATCCSLGVPCVEHWSDAQSCAAWKGGEYGAPTLYTTACSGFVALGFATSSELWLYDATNGYLTAIVESGAVNDTGPVCNVGPSFLDLDPNCVATWQATGTPCLGLALTGVPAVVCPHDASTPEDGAAEAGPSTDSSLGE